MCTEDKDNLALSVGLALAPLSRSQDCYQRSHTTFNTATPLVEYTSTTDNMFTQSPYREHLPTALEKVSSLRSKALNRCCWCIGRPVTPLVPYACMA